MKTLTSVIALLGTLSLASAAAASDLNNMQMFTSIEFNNFKLDVENTSRDGLESVGLGYTALTYDINPNLSTTVDVYARYYDSSNSMYNPYYTAGDVGIGATAELRYTAGELTVYGSADYEYIADSDKLDDGHSFITPMIGVSYDVTRTAAVFTEVDYKWNASNDWDNLGGTVEAGADFELSQAVTLRTSVVHGFDTVNKDETQLRAGLTLSF